MDDAWWADRLKELDEAFEQEDETTVARITDEMLVEFGRGGYDVYLASHAVSKLIAMHSIALSAGLKRARDFFERELRPLFPS